MKALKFLNEGAVGPYSGFEWPVPNGKPGKWVSARGSLVACKNGVHATDLDNASRWLRTEAYIIELGGVVKDNGDKLVARRGRLVQRLDAWDHPAMVRFAADCAEHVLRDGDAKSAAAIQAARDWADCPCEKHRASAYAAADAADAADAAADAAYAADATSSTAAAYAAAYAAAAAAASAASAAERKWQARRLRRYLKLPKGWDK